MGYCPDLFPFGGVCHGRTEEETYRPLCALVTEVIVPEVDVSIVGPGVLGPFVPGCSGDNELRSRALL
jgi:hypothetical protein